MLQITQKAMSEISARMAPTRELANIVRIIRERGDPLAQSLSQDVLEREVTETLAACDRLRLVSEGDRASMCMLEVTTFAGLRDVPKLKGVLDYADGPQDQRLTAALCLLPPRFWRELSERASVVRAARGLA